MTTLTFPVKQSDNNKRSMEVAGTSAAFPFRLNSPKFRSSLQLSNGLFAVMAFYHRAFWSCRCRDPIAVNFLSQGWMAKLILWKAYLPNSPSKGKQFASLKKFSYATPCVCSSTRCRFRDSTAPWKSFEHPRLLSRGGSRVPAKNRPNVNLQIIRLSVHPLNAQQYPDAILRP